MSAATKARRPSKVEAPAPPSPDIEAIRDALNDIDLRVSRIHAVACSLDEDYFESLANASPKDQPGFSEIFLVYCDALKHAAADIGACTERAFKAAAGAVEASQKAVGAA